MCCSCRAFITSRSMWLFGLNPCPIEKAFPGTNEDTVFCPPTSKAVVNSDDCFAGQHEASKYDEEAAAELTEIVKKVVFLDSEENLTFLWQYFAVFVDRVFLYLHVCTTVITIYVSIRMYYDSPNI